MLSFYNSNARALINTGVTHFFVSYRFVKNLSIKPEPLGRILVVETSSMRLLEAYVIYKNCKINVSSKELTIDLILLHFLGFDVILRTDWLKNYQAVIDCDNKTVTLHSPRRKQY